MGLSRIVKVLGATGLLALTTMSGCGEESEEKAAGSGGNAGASGAGGSNAGGGGKAGSGGSKGGAGSGGMPSTGGSAGSGGTTNGGEPGSGGEGGAALTESCMGTTFGDDPECNHCFVVECCDEFTACAAISACADCLANVGANCEADLIFTAFDQCLNGTCASVCPQ